MSRSVTWLASLVNKSFSLDPATFTSANWPLRSMLFVKPLNSATPTWPPTALIYLRNNLSTTLAKLRTQSDLTCLIKPTFCKCFRTKSTLLSRFQPPQPKNKIPQAQLDTLLTQLWPIVALFKRDLYLYSQKMAI